MTFTYKHYFFTEDLKRKIDNKQIKVVEVVKKMDLGSIVIFTCEDEKIINEIF